MSPSVRVSLCFLTALAVWLLTSSAFAAAPLCDARGAITFAPNPTLEVPNASIDAPPADDCSGDAQPDFAYEHGRDSSAVDGQDDSPQSTPPKLFAVLSASPTGVAEPSLVTTLESRADRERLERPPR